MQQVRITPATQMLRSMLRSIVLSAIERIGVREEEVLDLFLPQEECDSESYKAGIVASSFALAPVRQQLQHMNRIPIGGHLFGIMFSDEIGSVFPYSYAFRRCNELLRELRTADQISSPGELSTQIEMAGYKVEGTLYSPGSVLDANDSMKYSLIFEEFIPMLESRQEVSRLEFQSLLATLRGVERDPRNVICIPGHYIVMSRKL